MDKRLTWAADARRRIGRGVLSILLAAAGAGCREPAGQTHRHIEQAGKAGYAGEPDPARRRANLDRIDEVRRMRQRGLTAGDVPRLVELLEPVLTPPKRDEGEPLAEGYSADYAAGALYDIGSPAVEPMVQLFRQGGPRRWDLFNVLAKMGRLEGFDACFALDPVGRRAAFSRIKSLLPEAGQAEDIPDLQAWYAGHRANLVYDGWRFRLGRPRAREGAAAAGDLNWVALPFDLKSVPGGPEAAAVAYVIAGDGTMSAYFDEIVNDLRDSVAQLGPRQNFQVFFHSRGSLAAFPARRPGLADAANKAACDAFLDKASAAGYSSESTDALSAAFKGLRALPGARGRKILFLVAAEDLSTELTGRTLSETDSQSLLLWLRKNNADGDVHVYPILLTHPRPRPATEAAMRKLAAENGGDCLFVWR